MQYHYGRAGCSAQGEDVKKLTTTSHAILSLLAIRPWTGYELAKEMHRTVGMFWPRAERGVYYEPKNLVAHGLATATEDQVGARPRTVYEITDEGRAALREWLGSSPIEPLQIESEAVLRVTFGENGTTEHALATLQTMREQLAGQAAFIVGIARQYVDGEGPFPQRVHQISLIGRFLAMQIQAADEWAAWAEEQVAQWGDATEPRRGDAARTSLVESLEKLDAVASAAKTRAST